jgi:organic radical activating enzyme
MGKIIRVFPRRTSYTPIDDFAFVGDPYKPFLDAGEVHISCTFTWDKTEAERLQNVWGKHYPVVKLGGAAMGSIADKFTSGLYVRDGVTFTSRGCNNQCPWCFVPRYEGKVKEIESFAPGSRIADNNLLQCSQEHVGRVFDMLRQLDQRVYLSGGLQASLINDWVVDQLESVKIGEMFLACDTDGALSVLQKAVSKLCHFKRDKLRCYVMIGRDETIQRATARLEAVWDAGCLPFSQLYQAEQRKEYSREWQTLNRNWSRPAITKSLHKTKEVSDG